jgi:hypothetical protein
MGDSSEMREVDLKYPDWQKPVLEAVLELDWEKLRARVAEAEMAIAARLGAITRGGAEHHAELEAMEDALAILRVLKRHGRLIA